SGPSRSWANAPAPNIEIRPRKAFRRFMTIQTITAHNHGRGGSDERLPACLRADRAGWEEAGPCEPALGGRTRRIWLRIDPVRGLPAPDTAGRRCKRGTSAGVRVTNRALL